MGGGLDTEDVTQQRSRNIEIFHLVVLYLGFLYFGFLPSLLLRSKSPILARNVQMSTLMIQYISLTNLRL